MIEQDFHGPVGQVAGRDIINLPPQFLWQMDLDSLIREARRCKGRLWAHRKSYFSKVIVTWGAAGLLFCGWLLVAGSSLLPAWSLVSTSSSYSWPLFIASAGLIALIPQAASRFRRTDEQMIQYYRDRLNIIGTILVDRR